jgi:ribonucleoside-diphosphate reductase alpha chain
MKKHRDKLFSSPNPITKTPTIYVESVRKTERIEPVYCCVEPITHTMVIDNCYLTKQCFVLPIEDSRRSIYKALGQAAEIFDQGGGVGYNFSSIREKGSPLRASGEQAAGPISFMSLFDQTGEVIQQASRRGAQLACLNIGHPDIEEFIQNKSTPDSRNSRLIEEYSRNLKLNGLRGDNAKYFKILEKTLQDDQLSHFNISVMLNDMFMKAVLEDKDWYLISVNNEGMSYPVRARRLFSLMAKQAWESGDPGVLFYDRINEDNLVPYLGDLVSTNPCGEIPLLPYESCCLGSINLHAFYDENAPSVKINFPFLEYTVRTAVRFLDNVQTVSESPIKEIEDISKGLRRLGLGVMGWADLLAEMGIPYNSKDAQDLGKYLAWFISFFGWLESIALAEEKGAFPLFDKEKVNLNLVDKVLNSKLNPHANTIPMHINKVKMNGLRNVAVTSIAPTGTIALLAGVNSGIEPFFALAYKRNITQGVGNTAKDSIIEINPILEKKLQEAEVSKEEISKIKKFILKHGSLNDYPSQNLNTVKSWFTDSHNISPYAHVDMQASWQKYIDNSISKTINISENSTVEDIEKIIIHMWNNNLKGGTIYRNNSKSFQILNRGK